MKSTILLFAALFAVSGTGVAAGHDCPERGSCTYYGPPPVPPIPPMAPVPPMPPMPPAPPEPPPMPAVPEAAHAACADKSVGTRMTFSPSRNETMSGVCKRDDKGMFFELRSYRHAG